MIINMNKKAFSVPRSVGTVHLQQTAGRSDRAGVGGVQHHQARTEAECGQPGTV